MCQHGDTVELWVNLPARLSYTKESRWCFKPIDRCIVPIVGGLNAAGVLTAASCCGHGKGPGSIILQDGRVLEIRPDKRPTQAESEEAG